MADSKLEQFLNGEKPQAQKPAAQVKSALEEELGSVEEELVSQLRQTRAEELIAMRRKRIEQLTGGNNQSNEVTTRREASVESSLVEVAKGLLEQGLNEAVVGRLMDHMIGNRQPVGMYGPPAMGQGGGQQITITDVINLADRLAAKQQTDPAIASILEKLTTEITDIKAKVAASTGKPGGAIMVQQPDGSFVKVASSDETIVIPRPTPPPSTGTSLEEKKLDLQHEEKMEELKQAKERTTAINNTLASIPEKIGEGLAAMAMAKEGAGPVAQTKAPARSQNIQVFKCQTAGCGTDIQVPAGTKKIKCPKCGQEYEGE